MTYFQLLQIVFVEKDLVFLSTHFTLMVGKIRAIVSAKFLIRFSRGKPNAAGLTREEEHQNAAVE